MRPASGYAFLAALSSLMSSARADSDFYLQDEWIGDGFFQGWNWETMNDPTHGRVNYVGQAEAQSKNLTYGAVSSLPHSTLARSFFFIAEGGKFFMRADDWSIVPPSARGRDSIRISSQNAYDEAVIVLDVEHMPTGCGTWPAFWTLSQTGPWPHGGEIDIIEG
jgi:hypothetical protein